MDTHKMATRERPIIFGGAMVKAILENRKSQTRRVIKLLPGNHADKAGHVRCDEKEGWLQYAAGGVWIPFPKCPFGKVGDRLYVRETFDYAVEGKRPVHGIKYCADGEFQYREEASEKWPSDGKWKPSIHMPRWASRLTLEVTDVRVERVQEIGPYDAYWEGVDVGEPSVGCDPAPYPPEFGNWSEERQEQWIAGEARAIYFSRCMDADKHVDAFKVLWDSIAKPGEKWADSPYVWAVTFKRVDNGR